MKYIVKKILIYSGRRIKIITKILMPNNVRKQIDPYQKWIKNQEPKLFQGSKHQYKYRPKISIVVPCYNTPDKYIRPLINSIKAQTYENWELCIADGSTSNKHSVLIKNICESDDRFKYKKLKGNKGIVGNTNEAIAMATGEFIAFVDHDDLLSRHALNEVVGVLNKDKSTDLIYSDEDKISDDGKTRSLPFFKPDWSPELLLGVNYITHLTVVRKSLAGKLGGLREGFDGAQDYDFLLRITEKTENIKHIPKVLYHWRLADGSTAGGVEAKDYADGAGQRALRDACDRRGLNAKVLPVDNKPTNYRLQYALPKRQPMVSIIIPFKDKADLLEQCVESIIEKSTYKNFEILLLSNNSVEKETDDYLKTLTNEKRCRVEYWDNPFNYSAINNYGASIAKGEYLVLLNNDTKILTDDWLEELVSAASQPNIGAVGPILFYPNNTIQHAGVILGMGGMAGHVFRGHQKDDWTVFGIPAWPRNYLAVTGACLVIEKKKYDQMKGLDETFTIAGNDVALGIKLTEAGYRNVYWPFAELIHYENVSVGSYKNVPKKDYDHSLTYYRPYLNYNDPYFNKNIDIMDESVSIRREYESL
jgi:GT2 family glycosyltransferase